MKLVSRKFLKSFVIALSIFGLFGLASGPVVSAVDVTSSICESAPSPKPPACVDIQAQTEADANPLFGKDGVVTKGVNIFTLVVGVIAVIMMLVSGVRFVLSAGDANTTTSARNGIIYAVVGLVIVVLAQLIVSLVLKKIG